MRILPRRPAHLALALVAIVMSGCKDSSGPQGDDDFWDLDRQGIPEFVATFYIDRDPIRAISRFRSGVGHDYHDDFETCRSMKHYLLPYDTADWSSLRVYAPVSGRIVRREDEWAGVQLWIRSDAHPAFEFRLFHINLSRDMAVGDHVVEGEQLGTHIGSQTMSDIAVGVNTHDGMRHISFFQLLTDNAWAYFAARGVASRDALIITKEERDADPLGCDAGLFNEGTVPNWVELSPAGA